MYGGITYDASVNYSRDVLKSQTPKKPQYEIEEIDFKVLVRAIALSTSATFDR